MKSFLRLWVMVVLCALVLGGVLLQQPHVQASALERAKPTETPKSQPTAGCVPSNQRPSKCPTFTPTPTNTRTNTPVPPTDTPTNTPTDSPTNTLVPPTATATDSPTNTPIPPTNTPTNTSTLCSVNYTVTNQWSGGFQVNVTIKNTSTSPINGWTLAWSFPSGQQITQMWSATYTQSGATVNARNESYNGVLSAGGSVSFGFTGIWNSTNTNPHSFTLNEMPCS